jgi:ABC-type lipoprotein export system ATPase subunit
LKGQSLYDFSPEDRAKIRLKRFGIVSQQPYWLENLDVLDNVALPLIFQVKSREGKRKSEQSTYNDAS